MTQYVNKSLQSVQHLFEQYPYDIGYDLLKEQTYHLVKFPY
jgi:hypothetical protein